jgi:hypothetical protein
LAELINTALNGQKPFLSQKKAVEMFNYDDDDVQVQEEYNQILADMKESREAYFNDKNYFSEDVNDEYSEQEPELASDNARGSRDTDSLDGEDGLFKQNTQG